MEYEKTTEIDHVIRKLFPIEVEHTDKTFVEISSPKGVKLLGILGHDSIFIPLNTGMEDPEGTVAKMVKSNIASLISQTGLNSFDRAFTVLNLVACGPNGKLCSDINNFGLTTGIHLFSSPARNRQEFMEVITEVFEEKRLQISPKSF